MQKKDGPYLNTHLSKIKSDPQIELGKINSREDLFRELTPQQLSELQASIKKMDYDPTRQKIETERETLLTQNKANLPQDYDGKSLYDTSEITDPKIKVVIDRLNVLNSSPESVNTLNDKIKDIFSSDDIIPLITSRGNITENLSKDIRTDITTTTKTLNTDIERTPGFRDFLKNNPIGPMPQRNLPGPGGGLNPSYDVEMMAYANKLEQQSKAYLNTLPNPPAGVEHARMDSIIQGAQNLNVLSDLALRIDSGGDIDVDLQGRAHAAMTNTGLLANLSNRLASASSPAEASNAVNTYNQDKRVYAANLDKAINDHSDGSLSSMNTSSTLPGGGAGGDPLIVSTDGMSTDGADVVIKSNNLTIDLAAVQQDRVDRRANGEEPDRQPPFDQMTQQEIVAIMNRRPETPSAVDMVNESIERSESIYSNIPPDELIAVGQDIQASMQAYQRSFENLSESLSNTVDQLNVLRTSEGLPPLNGGSNKPSSLSQRSAADNDQKAAALVAKANELSDRLVLAPKGADSEELLNELVSDFLNIIRDQDYKTRQLVLAQLANQMMTDSITNFYKDKTDKNNKYHQEALSRMSASFEQNIQKSIQSSLVASASGGDAQSVAAVSGQVGAAGTAEAMNVAQLRSSTEQMLSQAQQMEPPLITNQQKEQILTSLFDNNPNNDALGIIALAGLQSVN